MYTADEVGFDGEHRETLVEEAVQEVFEVVGGALHLRLLTRFDALQFGRDIAKES